MPVTQPTPSQQLIRILVTGMGSAFTLRPLLAPLDGSSEVGGGVDGDSLSPKGIYGLVSPWNFEEREGSEKKKQNMSWPQETNKKLKP